VTFVVLASLLEFSQCEMEHSALVVTRGNRKHAGGVLAVALSLTAALAACSSSGSAGQTAHRLPGAAEPSKAPPVSTTPAGRVIALPAGSGPEGVAVDPRTHLAAVSLHRPDRIALVDTRTLSVRILAVPGGARHLVLAQPGGPVLLPAEDTNTLLQIGLPSGRVVRSTALPRQPHNVTVVDGNYWVDDELASEVSVVSRGGRILATLKGPVQPGGVAEAAGRVGAIDVRGARMYFYDASTYRSEGSIAIGTGPTHALPVGGNNVAVADTRGGAVLLVDMATRRIVSRLTLPGGPYGLVSDPATGGIWVSLTETNRLVHVVARNDKLQVEASVPTVQQPNTVARDPRTGCLYVAGVTNAQLEVICPRRHPFGRG
jgi:DNA-binding beta-propeller fold protein YncE